MRKTSLSLEKDCRTWAGSRQALLALCSLIEAQFQEDREEIRREYDQRMQALDREEAELSSAGEVSDGRLEMFKDARRSAEENTDRELNHLRTILAITDDENEETRDYTSELIDEHDFRLAARIDISCSSWSTGSGRCSIHISNSPFGHVRLTVSGDTPWVRAAFGALEKELKRRRPWWHLLRHEAVFFALALGIAASATLALTGIASMTPLNDMLGDFRWVAVWILFSVLAFASVPATNWLATRLFPNFEIRDPDVVTSRKRFSRIAGLAVGGFVALVTILQGLAWILDRLSP
ncbi:MAG TPA: hypothetical protein VF486_16030 [Actinomycetes bacterium]